MVRTITDPGINWNWYLCGDFNDTDKTVHIFYYERWHKYEMESKHPAGAEDRVMLNIIENEDRIAQRVMLDGAAYTVTNPQQVFSYRDFTHYKPEGK